MPDSEALAAYITELGTTTSESLPLDQIRAAWNAGVNHGAGVARDKIESMRAELEAMKSTMETAVPMQDTVDTTVEAMRAEIAEVQRGMTDVYDRIRIKDAALEAARELLSTEQSTLCEPDGTLGSDYESVLALIVTALV